MKRVYKKVKLNKKSNLIKFTKTPLLFKYFLLKYIKYYDVLNMYVTCKEIKEYINKHKIIKEMRDQFKLYAMGTNVYGALGDGIQLETEAIQASDQNKFQNLIIYIRCRVL